MRKPILLVVGLLVVVGTASAADLVIHEWGTITSIHEPAGTPAAGLNRIDESEVLPEFVHRFEPEATRDDPKLILGKRPRIPGRPDVTMRLETPVIYFHPPPGKTLDAPFDVTVRFRGGVLNEYYPDAEASIAVDLERLQEKAQAGVIPSRWDGAVLDNHVVGTLQWKGLRLHDTVIAPLTNNPLWLAPREVNSVSVFNAAAGEGEQYIFYRGVAHLDALLQTTVTRSQLTLRAPANLVWLDAPAVTLPNVWFADVRVDGSIAFREHGAVTLHKEAAGKELARLKRFSPGDYHEAAQFRASLKKELLKQGLFADEAEAMLNTWKVSYFQKPGLRVFYLVPREWTDYFLPLEFSVPARVNRVIVGRIDISS
ncbi:MAG: hypothetical protein ABI769_14045 [Pseudomonadota bacterium]